MSAGPEWQERGLCRQVNPDLFYPEKGETADSAKAICGMCDVRKECLQYALDNREEYGVWGGMSEPERRRKLRGGTNTKGPTMPTACARCGVTRPNHNGAHPYESPSMDTVKQRAAALQQGRAAA